MAKKRSLRDPLPLRVELRKRGARSVLSLVRSRLIKLLVIAIAFFSLTFLFPQSPTLPTSPSYGVHTSPDQLQNTESSPPSPPSLGGTRFQSPPELASDPAPTKGARERARWDLGGKNLRDETQETYVYTVASPSSNLPSPKIHPLTQSLAQWQTKDDIGDYFSQIKITAVGYLVWSKFPLKIYLEQPNSLDNSASNLRFQQWVIAIREAIKEWNNYLPLVEIEDPELADIIITRSQVDREIQLDPETGLYKIPRAITAQTTYEFYLNSDNPPILCHRMKVQISPDLGKNATLTTARHELGHALGIWGHSDRETDALYFSQVSDPPPISPRDINTLKQIYQQPTRLGWEINEELSFKVSSKVHTPRPIGVAVGLLLEER